MADGGPLRQTPNTREGLPNSHANRQSGGPRAEISSKSTLAKAVKYQGIFFLQGNQERTKVVTMTSAQATDRLFILPNVP
eukprot:scaffold74600_cov29-Tisochrysis_lutea.AAC.2